MDQTNTATTAAANLSIKKKKIVIGLPGDTFSSKFLLSWTSTLNTLWESGKYDLIKGKCFPHTRKLVFHIKKVVKKVLC